MLSGAKNTDFVSLKLRADNIGDCQNDIAALGQFFERRNNR
ncbi:hypothetical protein HY17_16775 [Hyphomonas sp. CY54-11-8]|nr:hypothetical protein HY17_16775 [Hyphomonas sp. CY54-11-8]